MIHSSFQNEPTFVGRNRELEELLQWLASAIEGQTKIVVISGEAGSGKTRLVNNFLDSLSENVPIALLTGQCVNELGVPYHPFLESLNKYFESLKKKKETLSSQESDEQIHSKEIADCISELISFLNGPKTSGSSTSAAITPEAWKNQIYGSIKEMLTSIGKKSPVVLFFEDIQWADSASLELLYFLSKLPSQRLLVIATLDDENLSKENIDRLQLIRQNSNFKELKLPGLASSEVFSLVTQIVGGNIQPVFSQKLCAETHGNPLFIVEYLRMLLEEKNSLLGRDQSFLFGTETSMPKNLEDTILPRLLKIILEQRKILDLASVLNAEFDASTLASLLEKSIVEVDDNLQTISQDSSLIVREGSHYRFSHQKSRNEFYKAMPPEERKTYHTKIAEQIEKNSSTNLIPQIGNLAYHYARSNDREKALKYSLAAGEQALSLMSYSEAANHFKYVVDNTANNAQYILQNEKATEELCDALLGIGNFEAIKILLQLGENTKSPVTKIRAFRKAAQASLRQGNSDHALSIVRKPLSFSEIDSLEMGRFLLAKGMAEAWGGIVPDSLEDLQKALKCFEEAQSFPDMIDALIESSLAYMQKTEQKTLIGNPEKALASILGALTLCEQTKDAEKQFLGLITSFIIFNECGIHNQACTLADEFSKTLQKINDPTSKDAKEPWKFWISSYLTEKTTMDKLFLRIYDRMEFDLSGKIELSNENKQDLQNAIEQSQKGAKLAENGNLAEIHSLLLGNLNREYSLFGNQQKSEETFQKLEKTYNPAYSSRFILEKSLYLFSKALFLAHKRQWQAANRFYVESVDYYSKLHPGTAIEAQFRQWYCCALLQQGQFENAMQQLAESKRINNALDKRLSNAIIIPSLLSQSTVPVDKEFTIRIDLANVGKGSALIEEIANLMPPSSKIISTNPTLSFKDNNLEMDKREIKPLKNETYALTAKATTPGTYTLNPRVIYTDNLAQKKVATIEPITIIVQGAQKSQSAEPQAQSPTLSTQPPSQPKINTLTIKTASSSPSSVNQKPFDVFLCYKKSSAKDFADHLKSGLEELGLHTFLDTKDIPQIVHGEEAWARFRDNALEESKFFILIMTPGFNLSSEVVKEIDMARKQTNKTFIFFRHRNMGRKIVVNFTNEDCLDIGRLEQVSFESKEELLRHAVNILPCFKPS